MRTIALLVPLVFCAAFSLHGIQAAKGILPTHELYSWQNGNGDWTFCLLYTTDRQKPAQEIFSEKAAVHGVDKLKQRIAKLPRNSRIVWFDRLTLSGVTVKGTEKLKYPSQEIIEDVRHFASNRNIEVLGP